MKEVWLSNKRNSSAAADESDQQRAMGRRPTSRSCSEESVRAGRPTAGGNSQAVSAAAGAAETKGRCHEESRTTPRDHRQQRKGACAVVAHVHVAARAGGCPAIDPTITIPVGLPRGYSELSRPVASAKEDPDLLHLQRRTQQ